MFMFRNRRNLLQRDKSVFFDIFTRIILLECVVLALLMVMFYYVFNLTTIKILKDAHNKILSQISYSAKYMDQNVKKDTLSLIANQNAIQLMYYNVIKSEDEYKLYKEVDNSISTIPYIHSVYIYNEKSNTVYTFGENSGFCYLEQFFDKDFIRDFHQNDLIMKPIPREIKGSYTASGNTARVFSYVFANKAGKDKLENSRIVVNVKASYIQDIIQAVKTDKGEHSGIIILNKDNEVIVKTGIADSTKVLEEIIDKLITYNQNNSVRDDVVTNISDNKWVSSLVYLEDIDWTFISVTSNDYFMKPIREILFIVLVICFVGVILSLGASLAVTKFIYSPIKYLNTAIASMKLNNKGYRGYNQMFQDISNTIKANQDSLNALLEFKKITENFTKENIIKKILNGSICTLKEIQTIAPNTTFEIDFQSNMSMMLMVIDNLKSFLNNYNPNEREIILFAVRNIIKNCLAKGTPTELLNIDEGSILCILNVEKEQYTELCINVQKQVFEQLGLSISITISEKVESIAELDEEYEKIIECSKARLNTGANSIIFCSQQKKDELIFVVPENFYKDIVDALKKADITSVKLNYEKITAYLQPYSYNLIIYGFLHLAIRIFDCLDTIEKSTCNKLEIDYNAFIQKLSGLETFEDYEETFTGLFEHIIEKLKDVKRNRSNDVIEFIKAFVEKSYADITLSHIQIAAQLNLSAEYINKVFKKNIKMSISEYIQKIRLDRAIELLKNSSYNVNEVIDKVGWENNQYFYTIFKKYTGLTPAEFRLKNNTRL